MMNKQLESQQNKNTLLENKRAVRFAQSNKTETYMMSLQAAAPRYRQQKKNH